MKDEIKESINRIQGIVDFYKLDDENNYDYSDDVLISMKRLLDYITNLQEEYEKEHYLVDKLTRQLNDEYKNTEYQCKQKEDYKSKCEKAIEYINSKHNWYGDEEEDNEDYLFELEDFEELLNILQGKEN